MAQDIKPVGLEFYPEVNQALLKVQTKSDKPPSQQAISQIAAKFQQPAQQPVFPQFGGQQPTSGFTDPYAPLLQELDVSRQAAIEDQRRGISEYEDLLKSHLDKTGQGQKVDLSPLLALSDTWFGGNLAGSYKRPTDSKAALETTAALQQGLQKARGALTDDEMQYLATRGGLIQKANDATLAEKMQGAKLSSQEDVAEKKLAATLAATGGINLTPGQKTLDVTYAKDLDSWTSGGEATVDKNLKRLNDVKEELKQIGDDWSISGRAVGNSPDILRPDKSLQIQQDVQGAAMGALKETLGAQFTEAEGRRIMAIAYDPRLPVAENIKKIDAAIVELTAAKNNKNAKASEFMQKGTLKSYRPNMPQTSAPTPAPKPATVTQNGVVYTLNPQTGEYE